MTRLERLATRYWFSLFAVLELDRVGVGVDNIHSETLPMEDDIIVFWYLFEWREGVCPRCRCDSNLQLSHSAQGNRQINFHIPSR